VDFVYVVSEDETSCMVVFRDEETFETTAAMLSKENMTTSLTWELM